MKKIAIADNNSRKFTDDLIRYWESQGHEVRYEPGASEYLVQWADVYYVDTWDNNAHYLWKLYNGDEDHNRTPDWDNNKKPLMVCRVLDWEAWIGFVRDQRMIDWFDKVICIAPHIERELRRTGNFGEKLRVIRPGVNLKKFPLKTQKTNGMQLGMALGDMWKYKNHMGGLDIFKTLYDKDDRWRLHVRGQHESGIYDPENWNYYLESRGIRDVVTLYPRLNDMNEFYENIDILLHPGQKEAFCYSVGEAMSKGIVPVINDFLGSRDIWKDDWIYQTHDEAVKMITLLAVRTQRMKELDAKEVRDYIETRYNIENMCRAFDRLIGL